MTTIRNLEEGTWLKCGECGRNTRWTVLEMSEGKASEVFKKTIERKIISEKWTCSCGNKGHVFYK